MQQKAYTILYVFYSRSDGVKNKQRGWHYVVYTKRTCQIHESTTILSAFDALASHSLLKWNFDRNLGEHLDDSNDDGHDVVTTMEEAWVTSAVTYRMWTSVFIFNI